MTLKLSALMRIIKIEIISNMVIHLIEFTQNNSIPRIEKKLVNRTKETPFSHLYLKSPLAELLLLLLTNRKREAKVVRLLSKCLEPKSL